jgi:nucleotide-binding universal stress UspA family protein
MTTFNPRKILIPIDFSETAMLAMDHAAYMAKMFKAELILLHVQEKHWNPFNIIEPEVTLELPSDIIQRMERKLKEMAEDLKTKHGIVVSDIFSTGNVTTEIVDIAKEEGADLIVMGTHGVSGFEEFFIGSNTFKVVTTASCPVISFQTHSKTLGFKNIVLPIDNSDHSRQKATHALVLAKHYGSTVHVAGILMDDEEDVDVKKFNIKIDQVETFFKKHNIPVTKATVKGNNQAVMTLDFAKSKGADLVMIMTDQKEKNSFLSTYAQQIVNHSKIPVMSIRPVEGHYESPFLNAPGNPFNEV